MADFNKLRRLLNLSNLLTDDEIKEAFDAAGIFGHGGGFGYGDSTSYISTMNMFKRSSEYLKLANAEYERQAELQKEINDALRAGNEELAREKQMEMAQSQSRARSYEQERQHNGVLGTIKQKYEAIKGLISEIQRINDPWAKIDASASKYAKTIGVIGQGYERLRKQTIDNVVKNHIGINYNTSAEELLELQTNYAKAVGRNIRLSNEDQENLAAVNFATNGSGTELLNLYDRFGISLTTASEHIGELFKDASKNGVSLEKYAKNVQEGLAMAQTYTFKDGIKGMEAMAKRAAAIHMEMSQIQSFADKFSTVESSIQNAAKLQVLGGPFAAGANPMALLSASLNGIEDSQKQMEEFTKRIGVFNRSTGEVSFTAFDRMRLKEYANITGQDYQKVMETTSRQKIRGEIERQIGASASLSALDDDFKEMLMNTATFKNGKAGVSINGEFKELKDIEASDRETLIKETQDQSADIKDIAKNLRSLVDMRMGFQKQRETVQAKMTGEWLGKGEKGLLRGVGGANWILGTLVAVDSIMGIIGRLSAFGGGGRVLSKMGKLFKKGNRGTSHTTTSPSMRVPGNLNKMRGGTVVRNAKGNEFLLRNGNVFKMTGEPLSGAAAKSAVNEAKVVRRIGTASKLRKAKQAANLIKGGKAAKVMAAAGRGLSSGVNSVGASVPVVGALVSAGIEAYMNKDQFKDRQTRGKALGKTIGAGAGSALGAVIGSAIAPGVGTVIGGIAGEFIGKYVGGFIGGTVTKIQNKSREMKRLNAEINMKDKEAAKAFSQLKGDYNVSQLERIEKAMKNGGFDKSKINARTLRKLKESGDYAMLEALEESHQRKKEEENRKKKEEREANRDKRAERLEKIFGIAKDTFGTARFSVQNAYFDGGILKRGVIGAAEIGISEAFNIGKNLIKGKKNDGSSGILTKFRENNNNVHGGGTRGETGIGPIDLNINGTLRLEGSNGQSVDIIETIKNNPALLQQLTELIFKKASEIQYGSYKPVRQNGSSLQGLA